MNKSAGFCTTKKILSLMCLLLTVTAASAQIADADVPHEIRFAGVPLDSAVQNLARITGWNFFIDPQLTTGADGQPKLLPTLDIHWTNTTAAAALARIAQENHLVIATNTATGVLRIAGEKRIFNPVGAALLGADTNGVIPMIHFADVPLGDALKFFINAAHLPTTLDPHITGDAPPQPPDFKMTFQPQVSLSWKNLTARQAIVELCEEYDLILVKSETAGGVVIQPGK
jgi:hypothetical protein